MGNMCQRRGTIYEKQPKRMRAKLDCDTNVEGDLSFKKDDIFEVLNDSDEFWWKMRLLRTNEIGFVRVKDYLAECDNGPRAFDCWFGDYNRFDAERHLSLPGTRNGTFLFRPFTHNDQRNPNPAFVISVLKDSPSGTAQVVHFVVHQCKNSSYFYLEKSHMFQTVRQLMEHYGRHGNRYVLLHECSGIVQPLPANRSFQLSQERLTLQDQLADGSIGKVYFGILDDRTDVVVREIAEDSIVLNSTDLKNTIEKLHALHHLKVAQLLGACVEENQPLQLVIEPAVDGVLDEYLRKNSANLEHSELLDMMMQVSAGMQFLETHQIVHGRLRAANVLVGRNLCLKVADHGLYQLMPVQARTRWTAVECFGDDAEFTVKSDVWSYGVVIYEVITKGGVPFYDVESDDEVEGMIKKSRRLPNPTGRVEGADCSDRMYDLMHCCWNEDPSDRLTFQALMDELDCFAKSGEINDAYSN